MPGLRKVSNGMRQEPMVGAQQRQQADIDWMPGLAGLEEGKKGPVTATAMGRRALGIYSAGSAAGEIEERRQGSFRDL